MGLKLMKPNLLINMVYQMTILFFGCFFAHNMFHMTIICSFISYLPFPTNKFSCIFGFY